MGSAIQENQAVRRHIEAQNEIYMKYRFFVFSTSNLVAMASHWLYCRTLHKKSSEQTYAIHVFFFLKLDFYATSKMKGSGLFGGNIYRQVKSYPLTILNSGDLKLHPGLKSLVRSTGRVIQILISFYFT